MSSSCGCWVLHAKLGDASPKWLGQHAVLRCTQCLPCRCREWVMWPFSARQDPYAGYQSLISLQQRLQAAISAACAEVG